jgi:hypothetical protein
MAVSNARIKRMSRELNAEPRVRFFEMLFALIGLGQGPRKARIPVQRPATRSRFEGSR